MCNPEISAGSLLLSPIRQALQICEPALQISFLQPQICRYLLELNYSILFNTFQDAFLILLGLEMMHGWYEILNSGCKMRDFAKFCRLQDIQSTQVPQGITVYLYTVSCTKRHVLKISETNCMSSMNWLSKA